MATPERPRVRAPKSLTQRMRGMMDAVYERASEPQIKRGLRTLLYLARVLMQVVRQWVRDRCPQQAASLAFQTALSVVPVIAVALAVLRAAGEFEGESALVNFLAREVLPQVSRGEIADHLLAFAGKMSMQTAGIAGISTTVILAYIMYANVESIFNDVWKIERRRSTAQKFVVFYTVATTVPALLGLSLYHAARYGLTQGVLGELGAMAATWGALFVANKLLPATKVRWKAAAAGALVSALAFEGAKKLFQLYVLRVAFNSYAGIYGTLALVPILLLWIYYSWLVVLFGAEVAHSVQNLQTLEVLDRRAGDGEASNQVSGPIAARIMCAVIERWRGGGQATERAELTVGFGLSEGVAERILRRLRTGGLLIEVEGDTTGYLPARSPAEMTLGDVLELFRGGDVALRAEDAEGRLDQVLGELEETLKEKSRAVTLDELAR